MMFGSFRLVLQTVCALFMGAVALTPLSAHAQPVRAPEQPVVVAGVALGDCEDLSVAMVRTYTSLRRPAPQAEKSCEGGRIRMQVMSERHFGHRIMDPVNIRVLLSVDPSVVVDFQSLSRGTVAFNGQEFDLVSPLALSPSQSPVNVQSRRMPDGRVFYGIDLIVQSSVPASAAPYLVFRLDLRYTLGNIRDKDGNATSAPDRRVLSTPVIALTLSPTAVGEGDFVAVSPALAPQLLPWATLGLLVGGAFLMCLPVGLWAVQWINRRRPGRKIPANELAWRTLDGVFAEGKRSGFSPSHFKAISAAVRRYLNASASTHAELRQLLAEHPHRKEIVSVLSYCDAVLYRSQQLDHDELEELIAKVEVIVPRP